MKEQPEILQGRCTNCGQPRPEPTSENFDKILDCCSEKCLKELNIKRETWKKENKCFRCGNDLYVDKNGKVYGGCETCVRGFTEAIKYIKDLEKEVFKK